MLAKMVYKNMDKKNVLLYSFSIILSAALEMVFGNAFMINDRYGLNEKTGSMSWLCTMFFLAAGVMSIFFVLYSTAYYVRTKNKDYSLLFMLGSSRKFIFRFFSAEFLFIYAFSVVLGILAGGLFSALLLFILGLFQYLVAFSVPDVVQVIKLVMKVNFMLFLLEYPLVLLYFCKRNLSEMRLREMKKEGRHNRTCFLVIGGIVLITASMRLLRRSELPYRFISMGICLAGVYMVMSYGGSLVLMLLFIMLVLSFAVLYFTGGSVISQMPEDVDSPIYPYGFVGVIQDGGMKDMAREMVGEDGIEISAVKGYRYNGTAVFCISDRDYSRLTAQELRLEDTEAVWINESTMLDIEKPDSLWQFAVLPEAALADYQGEAYGIFAKKGSLQKEFEQYGYCFQENGTDIFWRCAFLKDADENMAYVRIISIFAGVFCIFSFFGIFALKLQGDMPLLNQKYRILYHIGMSEKSIYKAMSSEYRKLMEIPVVLSLLLSGVYMAAEMTGMDTAFEDFICKYIPFQIIFVGFHVMYFCRIKKMALKKNTEIIMNE
ncbi:FtsX-like permease family protein [Lachnospiraceae bacterium 54-11]